MRVTTWLCVSYVLMSAKFTTQQQNNPFNGSLSDEPDQ